LKDKAIEITARINKENGYKNIGIFEPMEVIDYEGR
jgi:hypothetical protein